MEEEEAARDAALATKVSFLGYEVPEVVPPELACKDERTLLVDAEEYLLGLEVEEKERWASIQLRVLKESESEGVGLGRCVHRGRVYNLYVEQLIKRSMHGSE